MRASAFEQLAVVVCIKRVDEPHLADRNTMFCGFCSGGRVHH